MSFSDYEDDGTNLPPESVPFAQHKVTYASTSSLLHRACWSILAGGEILLCCRSCSAFHSTASGRLPRCFEWVHFSHYYLGQGPAGGRRLAMLVSWSTRGGTIARYVFKSFSSRYGVAHCSWGVWGLSFRGVSLGRSLVCCVWFLLCQFHLLTFLGASSDDKWCGFAM